MVIPAQIKAARALLALTQAELASVSGVSEISIKNIESGATDPRYSTLMAITKALEEAGIEFTNGGQPGVRFRPLRVGDLVKLLKGTLTWGGFGERRSQIARVVELIDDGTSVKRIIVRYPDGFETSGMEVGLFQRIVSMKESKRREFMSFLERASASSANHKATVKNDTVQISAIDSTKEALERFQPIAREAIANDGDGYDIYGRPHQTSRYSGGLYDMIVLVKRSND